MNVTRIGTLSCPLFFYSFSLFLSRAAFANVINLQRLRVQFQSSCRSPWGCEAWSQWSQRRCELGWLLITSVCECGEGGDFNEKKSQIWQLWVGRNFASWLCGEISRLRIWDGCLCTWVEVSLSGGWYGGTGRFLVKRDVTEVSEGWTKKRREICRLTVFAHCLWSV